jgi:hypothetical protein
VKPHRQVVDEQRLLAQLTRPLQDAADALHSLAASLRLSVELERKRFEKDFPHIEITPAFVGVAKYPNPAKDKPEEEGDIFPESAKKDRWQGIGPRERKRTEADERKARREESSKRRSAPPRSKA